MRHGDEQDQVDADAVTVCSKCRQEPRVPGQRWGKKCRAAYMRDLRRRQIVVTASRSALKKAIEQRLMITEVVLSGR